MRLFRPHSVVTMSPQNISAERTPNCSRSQTPGISKSSIPKLQPGKRSQKPFTSSFDPVEDALRKLCLTVLLFVSAFCCAQEPQAIVIHASTLFDGTGKVLHDVRIVVRRGKIESVKQHAGAVTDATYDLRNLTVMPGWIDTHVHITWHFDQNGRLAEEKSES